MIAAGAYLWELRERQRIPRAVVAEAIRAQTGEGTNDVQVMRIEKGQRTKAHVLAAFVQAVCGDKNTLDRLMLDKSASAEHGRAAADEWLKHLRRASPEEQDARRAEAIALIDELLADPQRLDRLIGYGRRLLDERESR